MTSPARCPDCAAPVAAPADKHCASCGQRLEVGPLRFGEVLGDFVGALVSIEFPILRTTRDLFVSPGAVARAWVSGRRRSYVSPIKFLVIVGVIVALAYEPLRSLQERFREANQATYQSGLAHHAPQYAAFLCIGLMVPVALVVAAFGRALRVPCTWLEWYALGLYCFGVGIVIQLAMQLISLLFAAGSAYWLAQLLAPLLVFAWGAWSFRPDHRWRSVTAVVLGQALFVAAIGAIAEWFG